MSLWLWSCIPSHHTIAGTPIRPKLGETSLKLFKVVDMALPSSAYAMGWSILMYGLSNLHNVQIMVGGWVWKCLLSRLFFPLFIVQIEGWMGRSAQICTFCKLGKLRKSGPLKQWNKTSSTHGYGVHRKYTFWEMMGHNLYSCIYGRP